MAVHAGGTTGVEAAAASVTNGALLFKLEPTRAGFGGGTSTPVAEARLAAGCASLEGCERRLVSAVGRSGRPAAASLPWTR